MSRKNKIAVFILIVLTVASLALVVISTTSDRLNGAFRVLGTPVRSLQRAVTRLGDNISQRFSVMRENKAIKAEIDRLIEENDALRQRNAELEPLVGKNEELERLLGVKEIVSDYTLLRASVITKDITDWFNEFTIDVGTKDGVKNGTVVMTSYGLVGLVYNAGYNSSKVRCIVDERSELMCRIKRNDELLRVSGTTNENFTAGLVADRIAKNAAIYVGDVIITADSGDVYPAGLTVGVVSEVRVDEDGNRYATVVSDVNFTSLTSVTVLLRTSGGEDEGA
ncbi:MAG: rod shape-determining protein MreC [Clostridia bacterium]|jgi:rod shape-determining protein MreC|nr:rod shape-determining protein MreC [Clostridia bacterium]